MNKKGDADIVATVLLIVGAIAMALLVTTFSKQTEEKVSERIVAVGSSVECEDVRLSVENYTSNTGVITLGNRGTLGVKGVYLRIYGTDRIESPKNMIKFDNCPEGSVINGKLLPQQQCPLPVGSVTGTYKVEVIPVIESSQGDLGCENKISIWQA